MVAVSAQQDNRMDSLSIPSLRIPADSVLQLLPVDSLLSDSIPADTLATDTEFLDIAKKMVNYANLVMQMLLEGYKIEEVSVKMRLREFGESMHKGIINAIRYIVIVMYTIQTILINNIKFKKVQEILKLPYSRFNRFYVSDNLNHYNYTIYY